MAPLTNADVYDSISYLYVVTNEHYKGHFPLIATILTSNSYECGTDMVEDEVVLLVETSNFAGQKTGSFRMLAAALAGGKIA